MSTSFDSSQISGSAPLRGSSEVPVSVSSSVQQTEGRVLDALGQKAPQSVHSAVKRDFAKLKKELDKLPPSERQEAERILQQTGSSKDLQKSGEAWAKLLGWSLDRIFSSLAKALTSCIVWIVHAIRATVKECGKFIVDFAGKVHELYQEHKENKRLEASTRENLRKFDTGLSDLATETTQIKVDVSMTKKVSGQRRVSQDQ